MVRIGACDKPRMLVRGMAPDLVENDLDATPFRFRNQCLEVLKRAENGIDAFVIADVIAEILHR